MLDKLSSAIKKATDKIANAIFLDKNLVNSIIKDLQRSLIEADVNVQLVLEITQKIKKSALDERLKGIEKKEHIIKLLHDELRAILGEKKELKIDSKKQNSFMRLGLYGSGKTTTISKLALYYSKRGSKVCAIGLDVHRPAASIQLKQLCDKLNIACFIKPEEKNPAKIWKEYEKELEKYELVLIDTAGRDALEEELIKEIKSISKIAKPTEILLVIPADIGQTAKKQAVAFKSAVPITGVIITRMDSTAKAGGALTACYEAKVPVVLIELVPLNNKGTNWISNSENQQKIAESISEGILSYVGGGGSGYSESFVSVIGESKKERVTLGNYKVRHIYKKDIYNFEDYEKIEKALDECLSKLSGISDNNVLKDQWGSCLYTKTKMDTKVSLESEYLLFDVNTGKKVVVIDGLHDVVINFAVKL